MSVHVVVLVIGVLDKMPNFIKVCPICFDQFLATRISQVYCPKRQCRNKARSYPAKILQTLLEKTSKSMQVVETMPKAVKAYLQEHVKKGDLTLNESIRMTSTVTPFDEHVIISDALKLKQQRERDLKIAELNNLADDPTLVDEEMKDFKLIDISMDDEVRDNLKFINKEDPAIGGSEGFSDTVTETTIPIITKTKGIRKLGEYKNDNNTVSNTKTS